VFVVAIVLQQFVKTLVMDMADEPNPYEPPPRCNSADEQSTSSAEEKVPKGVWRKGKLLVMRKDAVLPDRCVKTNQPASCACIPTIWTRYRSGPATEVAPLWRYAERQDLSGAKRQIPGSKMSPDGLAGR